MEREGGVGGELFVEEEFDASVFFVAAGADGGDLGAVEEAVGNDVVDLTGGGAEDAGEVGGLIAGERCGGGGPGVGDEAATGHAFEFSLGVRMAGWVIARRWQLPRWPGRSGLAARPDGRGRR